MDIKSIAAPSWSSGDVWKQVLTAIDAVSKYPPENNAAVTDGTGIPCKYHLFRSGEGLLDRLSLFVDGCQCSLHA